MFDMSPVHPFKAPLYPDLPSEPLLYPSSHEILFDILVIHFLILEKPSLIVLEVAIYIE
jgi:hypothetical protein